MRKFPERQIYFDPDNNPITVEQWGAMFEDWSVRLLAEDTLPNGNKIKTLWHGMNLPELNTYRFGTFLEGTGELEQYDDKETALRRHAELVEQLCDAHPGTS